MSEDVKKDDVDVNNEEKKDDKQDDKQDVKTYTKEEVEAMVVKEKGQGKDSLVKQFGFKTEEELKKSVDTMKAILGAINPKDDKEDKSTEANAQIEELKMQAEIANAKVESLVLGAKAENIDDIIALARIKKSENNDWKTAVTEVKTKHPQLFVSKDDDSEDEEDDKKKKKKKKQGTGGNISDKDKKKKGKEDDGDDNYGAKLAKGNKFVNKHKSYFE